MSDEEPSETLEDLDARLRQAREKNRLGKTPGPFADSREASGYGMAVRIGAELVAALIVGVGIGYFLDYWLDTKPWFLVVFFFLGAAAGVLNVYRTASGLGMAVGYRQDIEPSGGVPSQIEHDDAPGGAGANNTGADNKGTGGK